MITGLIDTACSINLWSITVNHFGFDEMIIEMNVDCTDTGKSYFDDILASIHFI